MEIMTKILGAGKMRLNIPFIADFIRKSGSENLVLWFGYGCKCDDSELYAEKRMAIPNLEAFVRRVEMDGIFKMGESNLSISDLNKKFEFLFCHEGDIHFFSEDKGLLDRMTGIWKDEGLL